MKKLIYSTLAFLLPGITLAVPTPPQIKYGDNTTTLDTVVEFDNLFIKYVTYGINLFWVIIVLFGIFSAFKYLTAKGDPKAAESAKQMVKYTVIAACVALLATVIKEIAKSILNI